MDAHVFPVSNIIFIIYYLFFYLSICSLSVFWIFDSKKAKKAKERCFDRQGPRAAKKIEWARLHRKW